MRYIKSNEDRLRNAKIGLFFVLFVDAMNLYFVNYRRYTLIDYYLYDGNISVRNFINPLPGEITLNLLSGLTTIFVAIVFVQWFRRAYYNLHQFNIKVSYNESMATFGWMIPGLNLILPFGIMRELFLKSKEIIENHDPTFKVKIKPTFVGIWWFFWILGISVSVYLRINNNPTSIQELQKLELVEMFNNSLRIVTALLAIKVITDYSKIEYILHRLPEDKN
jgi:hypothetical protein